MDGKKLLRLSIFGLPVILAAAFLVCFCLPKEPAYQGRTLTDWIVNHPVGDQYWQDTGYAIQHIGTNAFPILLKWVSARDSKPKARIISWLNAHPWLRVRIRPAYEWQQFASVSFHFLGEAAKPVWPELVQRTYDRDSSCRYTALLCLAE